MKKIKLHSIAPTLSEISSKDSGFEIPQNYFDAIEKNVISRLTLRKNNPKKTEPVFNTPENYFESLEDKVLSKLTVETNLNKDPYNIPDLYFDTIEDRVLTKIKVRKSVFLIKIITKYVAPIAIAASLLLVFILNTNQKTITFDSLATSEIDQFINNGFIDIDSESLASAFSTIELPSNSLDASLSEDEVLDYLYNEDIETIIYEY